MPWQLHLKYLKARSFLFYTPNIKSNMIHHQYGMISLGNYSIHHVHNSFFFGYKPVGEHGIKLATPEKALLDFLYLGPAKSKLFVSLPELELPKGFSIKTAEQIIQRIESKSRRALIEKRFKELIK